MEFPPVIGKNGAPVKQDNTQTDTQPENSTESLNQSDSQEGMAQDFDTTEMTILYAGGKESELESFMDQFKSQFRLIITATDGIDALSKLRDTRVDLIISNADMPKMDGFYVCAAIREVDAAVPVLFLSALGDEESQLKGFGYGADDYIEKTLPAPLFLARVEAALRRTRAAEPSGDFSFGEWRIRVAQRSMRRSTGETAELCDREIALLRLFAARRGEALSRDWIALKLWGKNAAVSDNLLSVLVYGLRGKLAAEGREIRTVRGVGYAFAPSS